MAELTKKLNVKKDGAAAEEIKLYSTLDEVNNKGVSLKSDGINCYAAYGNASDAKASALNYKPSGSDISYKVLKEAASTSSGDGVTVKLVARRNNEDYMQDLPPVKLEPGQKFYINNANAPTIEGYDFVCCSINNFVPDKDTEINVYYIPQTVSDRKKTYWSYYGKDATGDLSLQDYANTYAATTMTRMFYQSTITGIPKLNMSNATDISYMFGGSRYGNMPQISDVDARGWDVGKVTDMTSLFEESQIETLDASTWDTSNVTKMDSMFYGSNLVSVDISGWDTSNVTKMDRMFYNLRILNIDMSNCNTGKVTSVASMFNNCTEVTTIDLSTWDTSKVTDMSSLFECCYALTTVVGVIDMSSCTDCDSMFYSCNKLTGVHLRNVPRSLNISSIGGTEGTTYIIDNYLD